MQPDRPRAIGRWIDLDAHAGRRTTPLCAQRFSGGTAVVPRETAVQVCLREELSGVTMRTGFGDLPEIFDFYLRFDPSEGIENGPR
ncbi:hypothetical protein [Sciscionella marina]|uniref:hypothetical protein n=1 Tax=Sciscionella marina TaxID=508770 RepID=UPI0004783013|nr:hypothetical protein [Sciscionella marina]